MNTENETVADESNSASQTTGGEVGAQDDLDTLLNSFNQEFDKATKVPEIKDNEIADLRKTVDYLVNQTTSGDIEKAVDSVAETLGDAKIPKRVIKAMLNDMAIEDPRLRVAFENRRNNPAGWNKVLKAAAKNIRNEFSGLPDKQITDDRDAIAAAIRGASKTSSTDEAPSFKAMSDHDFEMWKLKQR